MRQNRLLVASFKGCIIGFFCICARCKHCFLVISQGNPLPLEFLLYFCPVCSHTSHYIITIVFKANQSVFCCISKKEQGRGSPSQYLTIWISIGIRPRVLSPAFLYFAVRLYPY